MTDEGRAAMARQLADLLKGGEIVVYGDASTKAASPLAVAVDGATVVATAEFGERDANFRWAARDVVLADGTVIDHSEQELGEKMLGAVWTLEVPLEVAE